MIFTVDCLWSQPNIRPNVTDLPFYSPCTGENRFLWLYFPTRRLAVSYQAGNGLSFSLCVPFHRAEILMNKAPRSTWMCRVGCHESLVLVQKTLFKSASERSGQFSLQNRGRIDLTSKNWTLLFPRHHPITPTQTCHEWNPTYMAGSENSSTDKRALLPPHTFRK